MSVTTLSQDEMVLTLSRNQQQIFYYAYEGFSSIWSVLAAVTVYAVRLCCLPYSAQTLQNHGKKEYE